MANILKASFELDTHNATASIGKLSKDFRILKQKVEVASHSLQALHYTVGNIKSTYDTLSKSFIEPNRQIQNLKNSLTTLTAVTHSNITSTGRVISLQEKYAKASQVAQKSLEGLLSANAQTPHTLNQTVAIFNSLLPGFTRLGYSQEQIIELTKSLSIASKAQNVEFNQLLMGVDGLASGTVKAGSGLGIMLTQLGITNSEIKSTSDVIGFLSQKLKDTIAIDSYDISVSNLNNSLDRVKRVLGKTTFDTFNESIKASSVWLNKFSDEDLENLRASFGSGIKIALSFATALLLPKSIIATYTLAKRSLYKLQLGLSATKYAANGAKVSVLTLGSAFKTLAAPTLIFGAAQALFYFLDGAKEKSDSLSKSLLKTNDELKKLSSNQLESLKLEATTHLAKLRLDLANAKADASYQGFFESDKEHIEDKAYKDELSSQFKELQKFSRKINNLQKENLAKLKENQKEAVESLLAKVDTKSLDEQLQKSLKPFEYASSQINKKWDNLKAKYQTVLKGLAPTQKEELSKVNKALSDVETARANDLDKLSQQYKAKQTKLINDIKKSKQDIANDKNSLLKEYYASIGNNSKIQAMNLEEYKQRVYSAFGSVSVKAKELIDTYKSLNQSTQSLAKDNALISYYEAIGKKQDAWILKENQIREKLQKDGFLNSEQIAKYIKVQKDYYTKIEKQSQKTSQKVKAQWDNISTSLAQSFEDNFFDTLNGKFDSLKDMFKDFGKDILYTLTNPLKRSLASSLGAILSSSVGLSSNSLASTLSNAGLNLVNGQWIGGGDTNGVANIQVSSTGEVLKGAELLSSDTLSSISLAKSAFTLASSNLTSSLMLPATQMANLASMATTAGYTSLGNFLAGSTSVLSGTGTLTTAGIPAMAGGLLTAGALGGVGGYALGSLGDKLFAANTKAADYGAIGGGIGAMIGSIVPVVGTLVGGAVGAALGSIVGGFKGSWKTTGQGFDVLSAISANDNLNYENIRSYTNEEYKSWFSSKSNTFVTGLDSQTKRAIQSQINNIDYLLETAGDFDDFALLKGHYSSENLYDVGFVRSILDSISSFEWSGQWSDYAFNTSLEKIWSDYAKSIDKTVIEAMTQSLQSMTSTKRNFEQWKLRDDNTALLSYQAQMKSRDASKLAQDLGVDYSTLNEDNFLDKYNTALKNVFDPEDIKKWNALANAFMSATDAVDKHQKALKQQEETLKQQQIQIQNALVSTQSSYLQSVYNTSKGVVEQILGINSTYTSTMYENYLKQAKKYNELFKQDPTNTQVAKLLSQNVSSASSYVSNYLQKENFASKEDYEFARLNTANSFKEFETTGGVYEKMDVLIEEIKQLKAQNKKINNLVAQYTKKSSETLEAIYINQD